MNPRTEYEMTQADYDRIIEAIQPVPLIMVGGYVPRSQQERANDAWIELGRKMGFDGETVRPSDRGTLFFTAVPSETEAQRADRDARAAEAKRQSEIASLTADIEAKRARLAELSKDPA